MTPAKNGLRLFRGLGHCTVGVDRNVRAAIGFGIELHRAIDLLAIHAERLCRFQAGDARKLGKEIVYEVTPLPNMPGFVPAKPNERRIYRATDDAIRQFWQLKPS